MQNGCYSKPAMRKKRHIVTSKEIGKKMKKRRRDLKISQEDLAELLGVTYQQVQRYESGVNKLNVENVQVIANLLSVQTSYFFEAGGISIADERPATQLSPEESVLIKYFRKTTDRIAKNAVIQVAKVSAKLKGNQ